MPAQTHVHIFQAFKLFVHCVVIVVVSCMLSLLLLYLQSNVPKQTTKTTALTTISFLVNKKKYRTYICKIKCLNHNEYYLLFTVKIHYKNCFRFILKFKQI